MPQVPVAPIRTVEQNALPGARVDQSAPVEAFGGGGQQATGAIAAVAGQAHDIATEQVEHTNQIAVNQGITEFQKNADNIQMQIKSMKGQDALAAQDFLDKQWQESKQKVLESAANGAQRQSLEMHANDLYHTVHKVTQEHMYQQHEEWDDATTKGVVDNATNTAVQHATDPEIVEQQKQLAESALRDRLKRKGIPEKNADGSDNAIYKSFITGAMSKLNASVITERIDANDIAGAHDYFAKNRASMDAADVMHAEKYLEHAKDISFSKDVYNKVSGMKLSDGNPDEARMRDYVNNLPGLTDERKQKIQQFVDSQAAVDHRNKLAQEGAQSETYKNKITDAFKNGVPLADALKLAPKFSKDSNDQLLKEQFAQELYSGKGTKTDIEVKQALETAIDNGTATQADIDRAYRAEKTISGTDWNALSNKYRTNIIDGKNPRMQRAKEDLKLMAKEHFGSDSAGVSAFMTDVEADAQGKTPEQLMKIARDKLEQDKNSVSRFWNFLPIIGGDAIPMTGQPQFQTDQEKRKSNSLVVGELQSTYGADLVTHVGQSAAGKPVPVAMNEIAQAFGGEKNILPGTPVYQAMQSLKKWGAVITPDSLKRALKEYPTGRF